MENGKHHHNTARVFLAIPINQGEVQDALQEWADSQRISLPWVKQSKLHITLIPPWSTSTKAIQGITSVAAEIAHHCEPFLIRTTGHRIVERKNHSVLWANIAATQELLSLRSYAMGQLFRNASGGGDYNPHIMLARWEKRLYQPHELNLEPIQEISVEVNSLSLIQQNGRGTPATALGTYHMAGSVTPVTA